MRNRAVQLLFAVTFAMSCTLFELIVLEIAGVLERRSRWWHWKLNLYAMLVDIVVVLPFAQIYMLLRDLGGESGVKTFRWNVRVFMCSVTFTEWTRDRRFGLTCAVWAAYFYGFWRIGDQFPIQQGQSMGKCWCS